MGSAHYVTLMQTVGSDYFFIIVITILRPISSDYYSGTDEATSDGSSSQTRREEDPDCCTVTAAMYNITESSRDRRYPISAKSITLFDSFSFTGLYICLG